MSEEVSAPKNEGLIRIDDIDEPIYRIFPLWFFEETLRKRRMALVAPEQWEDPFEVLASRIHLIDERRSEEPPLPLKMLLAPAYAQCWSRTEESDTLLRAYSRVTKDSHFHRNTQQHHEGVQVRTTARKLIAAARSWTAANPDVSCYLGAVRYGSNDEISRQMTNLIVRHGPEAVGRGSLRAELLLLKRAAFAHEAEIRLICVDERANRGDGEIRAPHETPSAFVDDETPGVVHMPIDPNELFDEVAYDPRLTTFERDQRETIAKNLGYAGPFWQSDLYSVPLIELRFPHGWKSSK